MAGTVSGLIRAFAVILSARPDAERTIAVQGTIYQKSVERLGSLGIQTILKNFRANPS